MIIRRGKNQRGGCQLQSGKEFKQPVPLGKCPWVDRLSVTETSRERSLFIKDWDAEILAVGLAVGIRFRETAARGTGQGA